MDEDFVKELEEVFGCKFERYPGIWVYPQLISRLGNGSVITIMSTVKYQYPDWSFGIVILSNEKAETIETCLLA